MTSAEQEKKNDKQAKQTVSLNFNRTGLLSKKNTYNWFASHYVIILLLLTLLAVLYFVVVQLPGSVSEPEVELDAKSLMAAEAQKPIDESPWQEAQLAKHRRQAQEILSDVLARQKNLEEKKVTLWAENAFSQAIKNAEDGDLFYRSQEFEQAMESYRQTLEQLQSIEASIPESFSSYLASGQQALTANNAAQAKQQLQIALHLMPDNKSAQQAFDRALVLDQVLSLVKQSKVLMDEQQLESSRDVLNQAAALDSQSPMVAAELTRVETAIKERDYSLAMSSGYQNLKNKNYPSAINDFTAAGKILPSATDPQKAIQQAKSQALKAAITEKIRQAQRLEQEENWQLAQQSYQQALTLDQTLISAKVGQLRSQARAELDSDLKLILDKPTRLANHKVFAQAEKVYSDALKIQAPGKKLQQQIIDVKKLLAQVKQPVPLRIQSDNHTKITLYRVGELGNFLAKDLSLTPGEYTITGSRDGYRDVRQEFTLMPGRPLKTITIACSEKVSNG
ncbi:hypothetical protein SG34_022000 [Thalassomonas viridans]|uniref:PEGA domain-containing protein n=1 Tax=Thalassomonas viridans TaxID=137584 RepID=A0AAE9YZH0_9GAMM|nr:hypothetical protein [Thalassomonas viridans]WDE04011.1 hypothetical protein SG34_022000 [Thalassomonas viridans]